MTGIVYFKSSVFFFTWKQPGGTQNNTLWWGSCHWRIKGRYFQYCMFENEITGRTKVVRWYFKENFILLRVLPALNSIYSFTILLSCSFCLLYPERYKNKMFATESNFIHALGTHHWTGEGEHWPRVDYSRGQKLCTTANITRLILMHFLPVSYGTCQI